MPKLKSGHVSPTSEEDKVINAAIKQDPDTREMTEADFAHAKVGATTLSEGKTRITIWLDNDVIETFKARGAERGKGYQTLINDALRTASLSSETAPVTEDTLRRIIREELHHG